MAGYVVKAAAVAARVAGMDRYFERGTVLPEGVENIGHLVSVGLVVEVVEVIIPAEAIEVVEVVEIAIPDVVAAPRATTSKPRN